MNFLFTGLVAFSVTATLSVSYLRSLRNPPPNIATFYFDDLTLEERFDYSFVFPMAIDFSSRDWYTLMKSYYQSCKFPKPETFYIEDLEDFDSLSALSMAEGEFDPSKVLLNAVFLEGLCRMQRTELVEKVVFSLRSKNIAFVPDSGPIICLLQNFAEKFDTTTFEIGLKQAIANNCITENEIISIVDMKPIRLSVREDLMIESFKANRLKVFSWLSQPYSKALFHEELVAKHTQAVEFLRRMSEFLISNNKQNLTEEQVKMTKDYLSGLCLNCSQTLCVRITNDNLHGGIKEVCKQFIKAHWK